MAQSGMHDACAPDVITALMQAGDPVALDRFARCYGERLVAVARRSCRLADDAEDAVQDALIEAERAMSSFRGDGSPLSWLSTLVVRRCHRLGRGVANDPAVHDHDAEITCSCHSPEGQVWHAELAGRLADALVELSADDRAVVVLAHEGLTGPQIGARLGLTANAVRGRLKRARKQLRASLADLAEEGWHA